MNKGGRKEDELQRIIETQEEWEDLIQMDGLKVVDIYQEWTGPCLALIGMFHRIKEDINNKMLIFAAANANAISSLEKYRGRSEPYFLFYGASVLVHVVKGANPPMLETAIREKFKQELEAFAGDVARVEIEDCYLKALEEAKELEAKRKALEMEIDQEICPFIMTPEISATDTAQEVVNYLLANEFEVLQDELIELSTDLINDVLDDEAEDADFGTRLNIFSKGPCRCLLLAKGPQGVLEAIGPMMGLTDPNAPLPEPEEDGEEAPVSVESIRDKFGKNDPKSVAKFWTNGDKAEALRAKLYPAFVPARVIVYKKETVEIKTAEIEGLPGEESDMILSEDVDQSSEIPEYAGLPRSAILVRPTANANYADQIIAQLIEDGYEIQTTREFIFTEEASRDFFSSMNMMSIFEDLITEMTSGPLLIIVAAKENVYRDLRELLGPESFAQAVENSPKSLRAQYSTLPDWAKPNDLTWIEATLDSMETNKQLLYFFPVEETLAAIKPDALLYTDELLEQIRVAGFKVCLKKEVEMTTEDVKVLYEKVVNKTYFDNLVDQLTHGSTLFLILKSQDAVERWRAVMGCADPDKAVDGYPDDLRAVYGKTVIENAVHGSSSVEHALKCIEHIFGPDWNVKKKDLDTDYDGEGEGSDREGEDGEFEGEGDEFREEGERTDGSEHEGAGSEEGEGSPGAEATGGAETTETTAVAGPASDAPN